MRVEEIFIWEKKRKKNWQISLLDDYCETHNVMMTDKTLKAMDEKYTDTCCPPRLIKSV